RRVLFRSGRRPWLRCRPPATARRPGFVRHFPDANRSHCRGVLPAGSLAGGAPPAVRPRGRRRLLAAHRGERGRAAWPGPCPGLARGIGPGPALLLGPVAGGPGDGGTDHALRRRGAHGRPGGGGVPGGCTVAAWLSVLGGLCFLRARLAPGTSRLARPSS